MIKSICIFCGSRLGEQLSYRAAAARLGELCGQVGIDVIYGGGHVGLMGIVADAAIRNGGKVIGLIPEQLMAREVGHDGITELIVTEAMSDRKDRMIERADAFAVLPGGLGTLDELFEVLTLRQLGYHRKPTVLVNIDGFWDPLLALIERIVNTGFAGTDVYPTMQTVDDADAVLPALGLETGAVARQAAQ
jgi:uncharacterized protein (TIGR00730 family)